MSKDIKETIREIVDQAVEEAERENISVTQSRIPGTIIDRGKPAEHKVPWTKSYFEEKFPKVDFYATESRLVTWNGLRYQIKGGQNNNLPQPIIQQYITSLEADRKANDDAIRFYGRTPDVVGGIDASG